MNCARAREREKDQASHLFWTSFKKRAVPPEFRSCPRTASTNLYSYQPQTLAVAPLLQLCVPRSNGRGAASEIITPALWQLWWNSFVALTVWEKVGGAWITHIKCESRKWSAPPSPWDHTARRRWRLHTRLVTLEYHFLFWQASKALFEFLFEKHPPPLYV